LPYGQKTVEIAKKMCYNEQDRIGSIRKEDFGMAFVALVYGWLMDFTAFWASVGVFFANLFGF